MEFIGRIKKILAIAAFGVGLFGVALGASASSNTSGYVWSDTLGWINFGCTNCNVTVTNSVITGYAWSDNYGWINLAPTTSGVTNTTAGSLGGYAFGEDVGWIHFSGVTIGCTGHFTGTATGDNVGTLNFSCTNCNVVTTWVPTTGCSSGSTGGGGRGGGAGAGGGASGGTTGSGATGGGETGGGTTTGGGDVGGGTTGGTTGGDTGGGVTGGGTAGGTTSGGGAISGGGGTSGGTSGSSTSGGGGAQGGGGAVGFHSQCNTQNQCVSVIGQGADQCRADSDCAVIPLPLPILPAVAENPVVKTIANAIKTPAGSIATKVITTTGLVTTLVAIFDPTFNAFNLLVFGFGIKKRRQPWGVVYDSVTKQPVDPAYVQLQGSIPGNEYEAITDIDGRYGFLVTPDMYHMTVHKTNYAFPSQKLMGHSRDELYDNLYFGEPIIIEKDGQVITKNVPVDSLNFDWNEFTKKNKNLTRFYSRFDLVTRRISNISFSGGFFVAIITFLFVPRPYNTIMLALYALFFLLRLVGVKPKPLGYISDRATGNPLSFSIVRIMTPQTNIEIGHRVADKYGRYYCLIPKGKYYVRVERKNPDGSYSLAYTSSLVDASKSGIIKKHFKV